MKKNLVIIGGGFGGVYTYTSLPRTVRDTYHVTIIDRRNYFLFTPLLHEVATGALESHHVTEPIETILKGDDRFVQGNVTDIDLEGKLVHMEGHEPQSYDVLVVATGSTTNFFGVVGAEEHAFALKDLADAEKLRTRFIRTFQRDSETGMRKTPHTIIVGGGPTGVELAGEAAELFFDTFKRYYKEELDFSKVKLSLINATGSLLRPYSLVAQKYAQEVLESKGIQVLNNLSIREVTKHGVVTKEGELIEADTVVWTAGVAPESVRGIEAFLNDGKRIVVNETLQLEGHPEVFVIGDVAFSPTEDGRGFPMLAQIAKRQGKQTANNIKHMLEGRELVPFHYLELGRLASLGQWKAIAEFRWFHLYGPIAWFIWRSIYLMNFASPRKRFKIAMDWTVNCFSPRDLTEA